MIWFAKIPWKEILTFGLVASKEIKEVSNCLHKTPVKERKPYDATPLNRDLRRLLVTHWKINETHKTSNKSQWLNQDEFTRRFNLKYGTNKSRTTLVRIIKQELDREANHP